MSKSNVAPLTIANLAMLERQLNGSSKTIKRRASRRTMSRTSAMTSDLDDDMDDHVRDSKIEFLLHFYKNEMKNRRYMPPGEAKFIKV